MPVYPPERLPATSRGVFPHMSKHDSVIWSRFLDAYADAFTDFAYDVALGGLEPPQGVGTEAARQQWRYATALKIDVVGYREDAVWVIEVKPSANVSAIGAALCYVELGEVDRFSPLPLVPVIVTDQLTPDIKYCAEQLGVLAFELPAPATAFTRRDVGAASELKRREGLAG